MAGSATTRSTAASASSSTSTSATRRSRSPARQSRKGRWAGRGGDGTIRAMDLMRDRPQPASDVRMSGFARRTTVEDALRWLDAQIVAPLPSEGVPLAEAAGRALAHEVTSPVNVPAFDRAMMDGFAVNAPDCLGASPYNRLELALLGESLPGRGFVGQVGPGQAVRIMTGAPMPAGADAVLPAEVAEVDGTRVFALADVSPGKHVGRIGEDIAADTAVLQPARVLRPQDVGVLASVGLAEVPVVRRPRVRIVVTGNELLPAGSRPEGCKIVDANGPMLDALVQRDGGIPLGVCDETGTGTSSGQRVQGDLQIASEPVPVSSQ